MPTDAPLFAPETDAGVLKEAVRLSEKLLDAQLTIISAMAQRAGALAAMMGAGATAMLGAELLALGVLREPFTWRAYAVAMIAPSILFAGCTFCGMAAGTSKFQTAGNLPSAWKGNVAPDDLCDALCGELENYEGYARLNATILARHAGYLRRGLRLGFAAPVVLAMIGAVYFSCQG